MKTATQQPKALKQLDKRAIFTYKKAGFNYLFVKLSSISAPAPEAAIYINQHFAESLLARISANLAAYMSSHNGPEIIDDPRYVELFNQLQKELLSEDGLKAARITYLAIGRHLGAEHSHVRPLAGTFSPLPDFDQLSREVESELGKQYYNQGARAAAARLILGEISFGRVVEEYRKAVGELVRKAMIARDIRDHLDLIDGRERRSFTHGDSRTAVRSMSDDSLFALLRKTDEDLGVNEKVTSTVNEAVLQCRRVLRERAEGVFLPRDHDELVEQAQRVLVRGLPRGSLTLL